MNVLETNAYVCMYHEIIAYINEVILLCLPIHAINILVAAITMTYILMVNKITIK